jgi:hypothetical protein
MSDTDAGSDATWRPRPRYTGNDASTNLLKNNQVNETMYATLFAIDFFFPFVVPAWRSLDMGCWLMHSSAALMYVLVYKCCDYRPAQDQFRQPECAG